MPQIITGIQQVGIGVSDINEAWKWYRAVFGIDVPVFDDEAEAKLMTRYTGGNVHKRRAVLALNMNGGGGFEIWQYKSRTPEACSFNMEPGDLGINAIKVKCRDIAEAHKLFTVRNTPGLSPLYSSPAGEPHFYIRDPYNNQFQVVNGNSWFNKNSHLTGGVCGVMIGVSDIEKVLPLYTETLGFEHTVYDQTGRFEDLGSKNRFRRILLHKAQKDYGAFSRLFGHIDIELVQVLDRKPGKLFENRFWGDPGFIHVCFDVTDMDRLQEKCLELGYPFTVDSAGTFDMGEAAGRFSYIEDPDGTLIEFVQAHKLPLMKKWGWYMNLKKRKKQHPLPDWMLKTMSFNRVKD